jgi:hypothetical protein
MLEVRDEFTDFVVDKCCDAWAESYRHTSVAFKAWFEMPEGMKISMRRDVRAILRGALESRELVIRSRAA